MLCHLSEKLFTVFGLSDTPAETAIGIINSLGLCGGGLTRDFTFGIVNKLGLCGGGLTRDFTF